ncbi:unnamed protein product [Anisakis simplex]|uniref:Rho-GAP domain-containing protein n=1 Tax=Anisakis simplex TaxID=6269 RepID=A0A158PMR8_ANISI|nr:unnamed protein product [Anisakis simplex]
MDVWMMQDQYKRLLPKFTLRHPSVDDSAVPLHVDIDETEEPLMMHSNRMCTNCDAYRSRSSERGDSHESSGFADSRDDDTDIPSSCTAPVSPCVPLSASSSVSEGWKYSQRLLWKLKPRYVNFSHASSASSSLDSAWRSLDSTTWKSTDGTEVHLKGTRLEMLSEIERQTLQVFALQKLNRMLPNVQIGKPKDPISVLRQKRQKFLKARGALNVGETNRRASGSSTDDERKIFGISLLMAIENDRRLDDELRCRSLDECDPDPNSSTSSRKRFLKDKAKSIVRSEPEILVALEESKPIFSKKDEDASRALPSGTQSGSASPLIASRMHQQPPTKNASFSENLLTTQCAVEGLSSYANLQQRYARKYLTSVSSASSSIDRSLCREESSDAHSLHVPRIVADCTEYLHNNGMNAVGLFRVAGSAKRCRHLRSALEKSSSQNLPLLEMVTPHDVATLLKEYFRDLPEPLLSKDHYHAYITAAKTSVEERIECIKMLIALLPQPNIDTLFVLLNFLHDVAANANDQLNDCGEVVQVGNKMDARNLATIFAPSILRSDHAKPHTTLTDNDAQVTVVETMIEYVDSIFTITADTQSRIFKKLRETDPDGLDRILNHLSRCEQYVGLQPSPNACATMPEEDFTVAQNRNNPSVENQLRRRSKEDDQSGNGKRERNDEETSDELHCAAISSRVTPMRSMADATTIAARDSALGARRRLRNVIRVLTTARLRVRRTPNSSLT